MISKLEVKTNDQLWDEIVIEGLKANAGNDYIRNSLIDAMKKEIFDSIAFRTGVEDISEVKQTPKNEQIVENVFKQAVKKWKSMIKRCNSWTQTLNLISEDDLNYIWNDGSDWDGDEKTAEWPELSEDNT